MWLWIVDCCLFIFNEKYIKNVPLLMQYLIVLSWGKRYLTVMAESDATNGLLWGRNNGCHLGSATFPVAPNMQTHTLCFNKSLQHHRQHSTLLYSVCGKRLQKFCLWDSCLCNIPFCQDTHYANALFTVHVTISRQWGPGAMASYQERWRREKEQTQWKNCQRNVANDSTVLFCLGLSIIWVSRL